MIKKIATIIFIAAFLASCQSQSLGIDYLVLPNRDGGWLHVEFLDADALFLHGALPRQEKGFGLYQVPIVDVESSTNYKPLTEDLIDTPDNMLVAGISDNTLVMYGTSFGDGGIGVYSFASNQVDYFASTVNHVNVGWSRNRKAVLLTYYESMPTPYGPARTTDRPKLIEMDLQSSTLKTVFESPEFFSTNDESQHYCPPFRNASGSPDGRSIVLIGKRNGGSCKAYLISQVGSTNQHIIELKVIDRMGPAIWHSSGDHFLMLCGSSTVCRYSPEGQLEKVYEYGHEGFFLADYQSETGNVLLLHNVDSREDQIKETAIAIFNFEKVAEAPSLWFLVRSYFQ
jgi:hypothetical protein